MKSVETTDGKPGNSDLAFKILERTDERLQPPKQRVDSTVDFQGGVMMVPSPVSADEWSRVARNQQKVIAGPVNRHDGDRRRSSARLLPADAGVGLLRGWVRSPIALDPLGALASEPLSLYDLIPHQLTAQTPVGTEWRFVSPSWPTQQTSAEKAR